MAVCKRAAQKYTRSRVRKALPEDFAYLIEELMTEDRDGVDKRAYYAAIIDAVIGTDRVGALIEALCRPVQRLAIDHLHIVGDIYDRGPYLDAIMDALAGYHSLDIQWGNHDIVWNGAALGQRGCIAHVVRNCARYGNLSILEDAYGINILPLAAFATSACTQMTPRRLRPQGQPRPAAAGAGDERQDPEGHGHPPVQGGGPAHRREPRLRP